MRQPGAALCSPAGRGKESPVGEEPDQGPQRVGETEPLLVGVGSAGQGCEGVGQRGGARGGAVVEVAGDLDSAGGADLKESGGVCRIAGCA